MKGRSMEDPQRLDNSIRQPATAITTTALGPTVPTPPPAADTSLRLERILLRHFDFASQTAQAVRQDASQMIYFYWVMFGVLAAGLGFLLQLGAAPPSSSQTTGLAPYAQPLLLLALLGAGTVHLAFYSRWVRLRRRYADCFAFMRGISTFYIERFGRDVPQMTTLLAWQPESSDTNASVSSRIFTVFALLPVVGSVFFAAAVIAGGEIWLNANGGAFFPLPTSLPLYGIAAGVFVLSLIVFLASARTISTTRRTHVPVLGDI